MPLCFMPSFYQEQQSSFSQKAAYGYAYVFLLFDLCGFCSRFSCHEWRLHVLGRSHRFFSSSFSDCSLLFWPAKDRLNSGMPLV